MDVEKLIERLKNAGGMEAYFNDRYNGLYHQAADTITQLRADLEYEREHADAYYEECGQWEAENEKLRAELEQVKAERDAAVESIPHECKTCVYHTVFFNGCTPNHDCTNPDGGCSNNCDRWKWRGRKEG